MRINLCGALKRFQRRRGGVAWRRLLALGGGHRGGARLRVSRARRSRQTLRLVNRTLCQRQRVASRHACARCARVMTRTPRTLRTSRDEIDAALRAFGGARNISGLLRNACLVGVLGIIEYG